MSSASVRPRIYVAEPKRFDPDAAAVLGRHAELVLADAGPDDLQKAFAEYDAVWIRLGFRVDESMLRSADRCRVLACPATGLDHIDLDACASRGIRVVSLKGEIELLREVRATAELTLALVLALLRRLPAAASAVLGGDWSRDRFRGHELSHKTVGLVGLGRLGSLVARLLTGFETRIIGVDPRADFPVQLAERVSSLDELLAQSDVVSLHVTYDASTRHLIGAAQLARMRKDAVLVNTSRGGVIDEAALLDALVTRKIGGAALDVLEGEPHPNLTENALVDYARANENLIIVPHIGGNTWESTRKTELFIANKVLAALDLER